MKSFVLSIALIVSGTGMIFSQEYFQQEVNYTITVILDDISHSLKGFETIQYINNSRDELHHLYFHLWPNAYKDNSTAFAKQQIENGSTTFFYADPDERGFIDSLEFRVNNREVSWIPDNYHIDVCKLVLNEPLVPGDTIIITTPFYVKIPGSFSRFGHKGQAYQISQWYPKPAVYDRYGWNQMPYLDQGEFYSEFGSYDVTITLPRNYVVGASGDLMTPGELAWLEKKASDTTVVQHFPASDPELKTIRYTGQRMHDFAWFADKRYRVLKGEVVLSGNRKVKTWALYTIQQQTLWRDAISYINDAVRYYSQWYGEYPYNNCSAVYGALEAGGAMEYPTITVVGNTSTATMLEDYIMHEVGHNWFYGVLGFNERKYPFLDEGLNTFSESRYMKTKYPQLRLYELMMNSDRLARRLNVRDLPFQDYYYYTYLLSARNNLEQPLNLSSDQYTSMNYGMMIYDKSALSWHYLMHYLGEEKFNAVMQQFYRKWQFRHPYPEDLRQEFEEQCPEDLTWFFEDLLTSKQKMDYAVCRINSNQVLVKNSGNLSSPVSLSLRKDGQALQQKWVPGFTGKQWIHMPAKEADQVVLFNDALVPEINRKNNVLRTHGLMKRLEPLHVRPVQILEKTGKTSIGILPATGWNNYNKALLGIILYSPLIPQQTFEYQLVPMYGFGNHDIAGMGKVSLNLYPNSGIFRLFQLSIDARRFGYGTDDGNSYDRARGELLISFKKQHARSPVDKSIRLGYTTATQLGVVPNTDILDNYFLTLDAKYANQLVLRPYDINFNVEWTKDFARSSIEVNFTQSLKYAHDALKIRFFTSGFLNKKNSFDDYYAIKLSGISGSQDYRYEHLFFGRFEQLTDPERQVLLSQQFVMHEGGFASNNPFAFSDQWLATLGMTWRVPRLPVYFFVNAGTYAGAGNTSWEVTPENTVYSENVAYEAGAMLNLGNIIRIYFPAATSKDISEVNKILTDNYWQTIRYSIDFNAINPFKLKNTLF